VITGTAGTARINGTSLSMSRKSFTGFHVEELISDAGEENEITYGTASHDPAGRDGV
jgi:hypothetical protein